MKEELLLIQSDESIDTTVDQCHFARNKRYDIFARYKLAAIHNTKKYVERRCKKSAHKNTYRESTGKQSKNEAIQKMHDTER